MEGFFCIDKKRDAPWHVSTSLYAYYELLQDCADEAHTRTPTGNKPSIIDSRIEPVVIKI